MSGAKIGFGSGVTELTGDALGYAKVSLPGADVPASVGGIRMFSENDTGEFTVTDPQLLSPETDLDYRLRVAPDILMEDETFNALAQNTGKFQYHNTTMTNAWSTGGMTTNSGNITTTTTGTSFRSYATFPTFGTSTTSADFEFAFSAWLVGNTVIDFGMGINAVANPYAPTDGVYFRATSAGLFGVANFNGVETVSSVMAFTPTLNKKYQFIIYLHHRSVEFWINDGGTTSLYGVITTPSGYGQPAASPSLPLFVRHAIVGGAASAICNAILSNWNVRVGGPNTSRPYGEFCNAISGSYQGLTGGTMGSLATYVNSTNPTAAVPANTALTANLPGGIGGQAWETFTLAVNTDGIINSFQVPAAGPNASGKRLKITAIKLSSFVQTVLVGGPLARTFTLAFGHTAVSLATAEAAATKARRIVLLPELTQVVTAAQAVSTMVSQPGGMRAQFDNPIYVNPGEFVALCVKHIGTVGTSGTIATNIQYDYCWE